MAVDNYTLKKLLISNRRAADEEMNAILNAERLDKSFFIDKISRYILHKFMLDPATAVESGFNELAELSMSNSMKISPELVKQFDLAKSCDGTSSVMAKKVLLFRSIEKTLEIQLPAMASARVKTLYELCELIWGAVCDAPRWHDKIE